MEMHKLAFTPIPYPVNQKDPKLIVPYLIIFYVTTTLLIIAHSLSLWYLKHKLESPLAKKMICLYLFYNVTNFSQVTAYAVYLEFTADQVQTNTNRAGIIASVTMDLIFSVISMSLLNVAMWIFAFNYYNIGKKLPYFLRGKTPPNGLTVCHRRLRTTFIVLNITMPVLYGASEAYKAAKALFKQNADEETLLLPFIPLLLSGFLEFFSFAMLVTGMYKMNKTLKDYGIAGGLDSKMMVLHLFCILAYLICGVLLYIDVTALIIDKT